MATVSAAMPNNTGNSTAVISDADIQIYQIVLWTAVALVALLALALYAMIDMAGKRGDAMLYSRFNPMWYATGRSVRMVKFFAEICGRFVFWFTIYI